MTAASGVCDFKLAAGQSGIADAPHVHTHDGTTHSHHHGDPAMEHGHTHEVMEHPGKFSDRDLPNYEARDWEERAFTVGIGG